MAQYSLNFRIAAAASGWDDTALQGAFFHGLSESIKDELAARDESTDLESFISLAIRLDNRLRERRREKASSSRFSFNPLSPTTPKCDMESVNTQFSTPTEEPMQLGHLRLEPAERQRRLEARLCFYCGGSDHFRGQCNLRPKDGARQ